MTRRLGVSGPPPRPLACSWQRHARVPGHVCSRANLCAAVLEAKGTGLVGVRDPGRPQAICQRQNTAITEAEGHAEQPKLQRCMRVPESRAAQSAGPIERVVLYTVMLTGE